MTLDQAMNAAKELGIPGQNLEEVANILVNLYNLFVEKDATMVEINPFAEDSHGKCKYFFKEFHKFIFSTCKFEQMYLIPTEQCIQYCTRILQSYALND